MDKPITWYQLNDPLNPIVDVVTYIYQRHTFLFSSLNKGSWNQEDSKIDTLGAFSHVLAEILRGDASSKRKDPESLEFKRLMYIKPNKKEKKQKKKDDKVYGTTLFRGMTMTPEELERYKSKLNAFDKDGSP